MASHCLESAFDYLRENRPYTCEEEIFQRLRSFVSSKVTNRVERTSYTSDVSVTENTHFFDCSFDPRTTVEIDTELVVFDCCESLPKCITSTKDVVVIANGSRRFPSELNVRNVLSTCGLTKATLEENLLEFVFHADAAPNKMNISFIDNYSVDGEFSAEGSDVYVLKNVRVRDMVYRDAIIRAPKLKL